MTPGLILNALAFAAAGGNITLHYPKITENRNELYAFERKNDWAITLLADPDLTVHRLYSVQQRNFTPKRGPFAISPFRRRSSSTRTAVCCGSSRAATSACGHRHTRSSPKRGCCSARTRRALTATSAQPSGGCSQEPTPGVLGRACRTTSGRAGHREE